MRTASCARGSMDMGCDLCYNMTNFACTKEKLAMRKWCTEDWAFELTVKEGQAGHCRLGLEKGDRFVLNMLVPPACVPKRWRRSILGARSYDAGGILHTGAAKKNMKWICPALTTVFIFI